MILATPLKILKGCVSVANYLACVAVVATVDAADDVAPAPATVMAAAPAPSTATVPTAAAATTALDFHIGLDVVVKLAAVMLSGSVVEDIVVVAVVVVIVGVTNTKRTL